MSGFLSRFIVTYSYIFEMGCVFCNSYLKELSNDKNIGRVSGNAWGLGFLGGLSALWHSDPVVPHGRAIAQRIKGTPGITG